MRSRLACSLLLLLCLPVAAAHAQTAGDGSGEQASEPRPQVEASGPAWLGVMLAGEPGPHGGVVINRPIPGSPAMAAAIPRGAEVMTLNGVAPQDVQDFVTTVGELGAGAQLELAVWGTPEPYLVNLAGRPAGRVDLTALTIGTSPANMAITIVGDGAPGELLAPGRVNVVEFWATWCGPCHAALPSLRALRGQYAEEDLRMLSVSEEDQETINRFLQSNEMPWSVVTDPEESISGEFWIDSYPTWVVIDRSGVVRGVYRGLNEWDTLRGQIAALVAEAVPGSIGD
jgi:thiol-disulfide isomerase/thioredoxin